MQKEMVSIDSVFPDPANARQHDPRNIEAIKNSLRRFGQQKPVVVRADGMIIAGNGTHHSAKELGWTEIWVTRSTLDGIEATAYGLADNRTAELATWDFQAVSGLLKAMQEVGAPIDDLGWADHELEPLLQAEWKPPDVGDLPSSGDGNGDAPAGHQLLVTNEQWEIMKQAINRVRDISDDQTITVGRALELICGDYLAGP